MVKYPGVQEIAEEAVPEFLSGKLARYKFPKRTVRVNEIPRNGAGKVLKGRLKAEYLNQST